MPEIKQTQDNRRIFIDTLIELAEQDEKIMLIVPDVGFNYIERFKEKFPNRFINTGVNEQFAIIFASALALSGFRPYVYSMINFVLFRPADMVRNGIVCHKANVKLIGVAGSSSYKFLGFSHNLLHQKEDINFCNNIGLEVYTPQEEGQVRYSIRDSYAKGEPSYTRL